MFWNLVGFDLFAKASAKGWFYLSGEVGDGRLGYPSTTCSSCSSPYISIFSRSSSESLYGRFRGLLFLGEPLVYSLSFPKLNFLLPLLGLTDDVSVSTWGGEMAFLFLMLLLGVDDFFEVGFFPLSFGCKSVWNSFQNKKKFQTIPFFFKDSLTIRVIRPWCESLLETLLGFTFTCWAILVRALWR